MAAFFKASLAYTKHLHLWAKLWPGEKTRITDNISTLKQSQGKVFERWSISGSLWLRLQSEHSVHCHSSCACLLAFTCRKVLVWNWFVLCSKMSIERGCLVGHWLLGGAREQKTIDPPPPLLLAPESPWGRESLRSFAAIMWMGKGARIFTYWVTDHSLLVFFTETIIQQWSIALVIQKSALLILRMWVSEFEVIVCENVIMKFSDCCKNSVGKCYRWWFTVLILSPISGTINDSIIWD